MEAQEPGSGVRQSPVADIGNLVNEAWINGFLQPTIAGLAIREGQSEGIDRPYAFLDPKGAVIYEAADKIPLSGLLNRALGRMMISGERGSGKTILMLQLVRELIPIAENIHHTSAPLYLNVGSWVNPQKQANEQPKIKDWILSRLIKEYQLHPKRAKDLVDGGNFIYCFDGLDDICESLNETSDKEELTNPQSLTFQRELLDAFILQLTTLADDRDQQIIVTGGSAVEKRIAESGMSFYTAKMKSWTHDDLSTYLKQRGLGALVSFIDTHPEIEERLIKNFSELQMLGTIFQEKQQILGLEDRAAEGIDEFFVTVYDIYLKGKYNNYARVVQHGQPLPTGVRSKKQRRGADKEPPLPISRKEISDYIPAIASYISQPGQGEAFRLDTLQPYELPEKFRNIYRWYAGLLIGSGITLTAGIPVLVCVAIEHPLHGATFEKAILHSLMAILGYILVGIIAALGYRFSTKWKFGIAIGIAFAIGKGFASGCSASVPGLIPGWDAGIRNGLTALIGGTPIFAAIFWQTREEPFTIVPIEMWDTDKGKLLYWMFGATALGTLFAIQLGWARGLSYAFLLGIFAWARFSRKPRMAPLHVRPNQAIIYSFKNAVWYSVSVALVVSLLTGISFSIAYGVREGVTDAIMALACCVSIFFFGGMPVVKHIALRMTLKHAHLVSGKLGVWLQTAADIGLLRQVGGGYVFSSDDSRRQYASRLKKEEDLYKLQWGLSQLDR